MNYGCPLCNGFMSVDKQCPECGHQMKDSGMLEDYYGPYSPYDDMDLYEPPGLWKMAEVSPCVHLLSCPECGYDARIGISLVTM